MRAHMQLVEAINYMQTLEDEVAGESRALNHVMDEVNPKQQSNNQLRHEPN